MKFNLLLAAVPFLLVACGGEEPVPERKPAPPLDMSRINKPANPPAGMSDIAPTAPANQNSDKMDNANPAAVPTPAPSSVSSS